MTKNRYVLKRAGGYDPSLGRENHDSTLESLELAAEILGRRGGRTRAKTMSPEDRSARASAAAKARWGELRKRICVICGTVLGAGRLAKFGHIMAHVECVHPGRVAAAIGCARGSQYTGGHK